MSQKSTNKLIHELAFDRVNRKTLFLSLPEEQRAYTLLQLSKHIQFQLITSISDKELINTLEQLDPDEATDIVQLLPKPRAKKILKGFSEDLMKNVEILREFDPKTAAGLMNLDYIQVDINSTFASVAKHFQVHEKRTGRLAAIIATQNGRMVGYLPGHTLGFGKPSESIKTHIRKLMAIKHNASEEEVVDFFRQYPHNKIAVLGDLNNVMGIIYSDDILRALREEESASLYNFAGVHDEENVTDSASQKIHHRYQWLIINLATAFLAAFTVSIFDATISKYVLLAVYMPIVAGMGGNAATQTLAVLVRGIALNQIELRTAWPTLKREMLAAFANGLINGVLVAGVVLIFNRDAKIAFVLAMAMITNLLVAATFGTMVPLVMQKFGKDPATSATVFITTATDVLGFIAFLGLATLILK